MTAFTMGSLLIRCFFFSVLILILLLLISGAFVVRADKISQKDERRTHQDNALKTSSSSSDRGSRRNQQSSANERPPVWLDSKEGPIFDPPRSKSKSKSRRRRGPRRDSQVLQAGRQGIALGNIDETAMQRRNPEEIQDNTAIKLKPQLQKHWGGKGNEELQAKRTEFDRFGGAHVRFTQRVMGMEVEGAAMVAHIASNGTITAINGEFVSEFEDEKLLQKDLARVWERTDVYPQQLLEQAASEAGINDGVWSGRPERAVVRRSDDGRLCLAFKRLVEYNSVDEISGAEIPQKDLIFADATYTGPLLAGNDNGPSNNIFRQSSNGQGQRRQQEQDVANNIFSHPDDGQDPPQDDQTKSNSIGALHNIFSHSNNLKQGQQQQQETATDEDEEMITALCARYPQYFGLGAAVVPQIRTFDCYYTDPCQLANPIKTPYRINSDIPELTAAHNYAIATFDYFYNNFGRVSMDGNNMTLKSAVNFGLGYNNAFWNGAVAVFGSGDGDSYTDYSLDADVVGHEFTQ